MQNLRIDIVNEFINLPDDNETDLQSLLNQLPNIFPSEARQTFDQITLVIRNWYCVIYAKCSPI